MARGKALRRAARTWTRKHHSLPILFHNCSFIILLMDLYEETRTLSLGEYRLRKRCRERVATMIKDRAAWWKQRGKCRALSEGDANTRYFHARASGRLRHNRIQLIEVDGAQLFAHDDKVAAITSYYRGIMGQRVQTAWAFNLEDLYADLPRADGAALTAQFTENEACAAIKSMNASSAPGPDGIGPSFYKAAWEAVRGDVMSFLQAFHAGRVDLQRINRAHIVLIPKCVPTIAPASFRPVSLQNCPIKILTKILTARLQSQIQKLVDID